MDNIKSLGIPQRHQPAKIVDLKVRTGDNVDKQAPLLTYEYSRQIDTSDPQSEDALVIKALHKKANADGTYSMREFLRTPFEGVVSSVLCSIGDVVSHGQALVEVDMPCAHGAVFNGLCGLCGKDVSGVDTSGVPNTTANIDMFHDATGLRVSADVAAAIDADTRKMLWDHKKLSLIIDLDQTIIHATDTTNPGFGQWLTENYRGPDDTTPENAPESAGASEDSPAAGQQLPSDVASFFLPQVAGQFFIKYRPGLRGFLENIAQYYEMHIYTMGTRPYADAVAAAIDPDRRFFNRRILSRNESGSDEWKHLERLFPVDTSMVTILDDRADVWRRSPNLIKVHPYVFFKGVGDINAGKLKQHQAAAPPLLDPTPEADSNTGNHPQASDEGIQAETESSAEPAAAEARTYLTDHDRELYILEGVLIRIHAKYYEELAVTSAQELPPPDLAQILSRERQQVLSGVTLVFSSTFPIAPGSPRPQDTDLWWRASSFGARCELEVSDRTTHVVAGKPGTEKVNQARQRHRRAGKSPEASTLPIVVNPKWLLDSLYHWQRQDETAYLWYAEDRDAVARLRGLQLQGAESVSPPKRKSEDNGTPGNARKQARGPLHKSVRRVLERDDSREALNGYESSNTTDIEAELERQEAGLEDHEAEVDSFVQNIDWDDLEREAMEDSESDDSAAASDHDRPAPREELRQVAMRRAARGRSRASADEGAATDSSDVFTDESGASSSNSGGEEDSQQHHRMKRRKTSPLHESQSADDEPKQAEGGTARSRLAGRLGIPLSRKSKRRPGSHGDSSGDSSGDEYYEGDRNVVNERLFAGVEDRQGGFVDDNSDDSADFANASELEAEEGRQWGEDDDSDEDNFDDLINNLEEEISSP
ncbi:CTD phosphatase Fcp1 [Coemansia sp. RSA 2708]|nr:CTD phosphatase Fcp1 [Coemansia sp. RSA 2708]